MAFDLPPALVHMSHANIGGHFMLHGNSFILVGILYYRSVGRLTSSTARVIFNPTRITSSEQGQPCRTLDQKHRVHKGGSRMDLTVRVR